jgi:hypothetical protein
LIAIILRPSHEDSNHVADSRHSTNPRVPGAKEEGREEGLKEGVEIGFKIGIAVAKLIAGNKSAEEIATILLLDVERVRKALRSIDAG